MIELKAGSATDVGLVRTNNQDQLLLADPLYAVADGMGGHAAGEVASAVAVAALHQAFSAAGPGSGPDDLVEAAQTANRAVWEEAEINADMRGMGTTLVAIALVDGPQLAIINIGDSRLYVFHAGELRQVTSDHNLVSELVAEGRISKEEAEVHPRRNIMTRALGVEPHVPVDLFVEEPRPGDRYLLCSDGLSRELNDDRIASVLRRLADPQEAAKELVEEAKRSGGNDNITVVVVDVVDPTGEADKDVTASATEAEPAGDTIVLPIPEDGTEDPEPSDAGPSNPKRKLRRPQVRALNLRVVGFVLLVVIVIGAGVGGLVWYARSGYFVGLDGKRIVIYQGRPGGVLWFEPTVAEVTPHTTDDVMAVAVPELQAGQEEPSLGAARTFVTNLVTLSDKSKAALKPPPVVSPTTSSVPTTTVAASGSTRPGTSQP